ncbi:MAG: VWA domain-containing protein [Bryobacteraceae bacterium]|nr:VWA domain-containing protein [Solibacteraceae bacterium]MCL4840998.1 VWA domain-containing protein [Bryobacteraceae bacterium]MCO5350157.1 VWA domain-containing protein [Bryobacteraceae bacterium]
MRLLFLLAATLLTAMSFVAVTVAAQPPIPGVPKPGEVRTMPGTAAVKEPATTAKPETPSVKPPVIEEELDGPVFRDAVTVILVPTTVTDKRGNVVNGLRPEDFTLYDNDKQQEINRDVAFLPLSMVVCVQRSRHTANMLPKIQKMGSLMRDMLVGDEGEAAILSFHHKVEKLTDFTNDPDKIDAALKNMSALGENARLNDCVNEATFMLRSKKDRRRVILLISETLDRSSEAHPREVATTLQVHNIDLYTVNISRLVTLSTTRPAVPRPDHLPPGARPRIATAPMDPTSQNQWSGAQGFGGDALPALVELFRFAKGIFVRNPAELYTQYTGGREFTFITERDLENALANIGAELRSQYLLSYTPNNQLEGGFHRIRVEVNRPDLKVRTRLGYWLAAIPR